MTPCTATFFAWPPAGPQSSISRQDIGARIGQSASDMPVDSCYLTCRSSLSRSNVTGTRCWRAYLVRELGWELYRETSSTGMVLGVKCLLGRAATICVRVMEMVYGDPRRRCSR